MPFTPISGKDGKVLIGTNSVGEITFWRLSEMVETDRFGSSEGAGKKKTIAGTGSMSGSVSAKWASTAESSCVPGASVTLLLYHNSTLKWSVPAVIKSREIGVDIDNGRVITADFTWESDGAWTPISF